MAAPLIHLHLALLGLLLLLRPPSLAFATDANEPLAGESLVPFGGARRENRASAAPRERAGIEFPPWILRHPKVTHFIRIFSGSGRATLRRALERSGRYEQSMSEIFRSEGVPQELLHLCIIESGFSPLAVSHSRTSGLWQFTSTTARKYGLKIDSWLDERKDPIKSTRAAALYLKDLYGEFGDWLWAVAAYNSGENAIKRALASRRPAALSPLDGKIPLASITRDFVAKFVAIALIARDPARYGFHEVAYDEHLNYDEVVVAEPLSLQTIAQRTSTTVDALVKLNPALLRGAIPPQERAFVLRLPVGRGGILSGFPFALPDLPRLPFPIPAPAADERGPDPTAAIEDL
ncbi:MAG TPA: lytic transglycosylase domain-containing protein [Candidatus Acidoferrales bacterium]|nr:lytic transglycosylase domain-containing protein [Candidatus Acidoferrales bacterium]